MKKPRRRPGNSARIIKRRPKNGETQLLPPQPLPLKETSQRLPFKESTWKDRLRNFWVRILAFISILSAVVTVLAWVWSYWPTIEIEANPVTDKTNPFNAEFTIKNAGKIPVYGIIFSCTVKSPGLPTILTEGNATRSPLGNIAGQGTSYLAVSDSVTRNCAFGFRTPMHLINASYPAIIHATAEYSWPFIKLRSSTSRTFGSRTTPAGDIVLVPNSGW